MTMLQLYKRSQHLIAITIIFFILLLSCQSSAFARAQQNGELPTKADIQSQLDTLNKQKDLSAQDKLVQQDLIDTLATLDKIERVKDETVQLRQKVAQAPENMREATAALNSLSDVDNDDETRKTLSTLSCDSLSRASPRYWMTCKARKTIWRLITVSWSRCRRSLSACKTRCTPPHSKCSKSAIDWMGPALARRRYAPVSRCCFRHSRHC